MLSRRSLLAVPAAFMVSRVSAGTPPGSLVSVRGTRLFVDAYGDSGAPPIVYVHGGPGSGSYDAGVYQGERLGMAARLLCLDQRGVLRSDPVTSVTVDDLVEDLEALRLTLGIRRWTLWAHSFGGTYATRYAARYPSAVAGLIYENCPFYPEDTVQAMLEACAVLLETKGDKAGAIAARAKASATMSTHDKVQAYVEISQKFGPDRDKLYVHHPELFGFFPKLVEASKLGALWGRCDTHYKLVSQDPTLFEDVRPMLARITAPALVVKGAYDYVTTPDQIAVFRKGPNRSVEVFQESSHFVHVEEADGFARSVLRFVRNNRA